MVFLLHKALGRSFRLQSLTKLGISSKLGPDTVQITLLVLDHLILTTSPRGNAIITRVLQMEEAQRSPVISQILPASRLQTRDCHPICAL